MKLSLRSEYALLTLIQVARQPDAPTSSVSIGDSQQIPSEMLQEILTTLVNARYLRLTKGNFRLAKTAEKSRSSISFAYSTARWPPSNPSVKKAISRPRWKRKRN